jgi:hypothetical protein
MMFLEQIAKRFVGQLLKRRAAVASQKVQCIPGLVIELNALAVHHGLLLG